MNIEIGAKVIVCKGVTKNNLPQTEC